MAEAWAEESIGRRKITVDREEIKILGSLCMIWEEISQIMEGSVKMLQRKARRLQYQMIFLHY